MGEQRLPRDAEGQRRWARQRAKGMNIPPLAVFLHKGESPRQAYHRIFFAAFELGAEAALAECLAELARPDDPCAGLPPHLVKSAKAAARAAERRKRRQRSADEPDSSARPSARKVA